MKAAFHFFRKKFRYNMASISRSGAVVRHRNFQSVIGRLKKGFNTLKAAFYFIFFIFRFNWVLISRTGPIVRHGTF